MKENGGFLNTLVFYSAEAVLAGTSVYSQVCVRVHILHVYSILVLNDSQKYDGQHEFVCRIANC